jgi:iron complex outermembrane receptor protein
MKSTARARLLATTLLMGAAALATPAFAQDQSAGGTTTPQTTTPGANDQGEVGMTTSNAAPTSENSSGDVIVTGSLIKNPALVASSPVTVVGQEEIQLRQTNTAEQILRDLPGVVPSTGSAVNNGNGGASFVDLRGLGSFRNVVLLDGNRIAPSGLVGRVDLNNIPLALVERADVLTGGAATTYGADAVSGVINFITRSDFAGVDAQVSNQITGRGDGHYFRGDLTIGANFDDGRGNAVFSVGYQQADPVYQGSRDYSSFSIDSITGAAGGSGTTVPSRFTGGGSGTRSIVPETGALSAAGVFTPFNFNPYNIFFTPFERFNMYGAGHYDVSDSLTLYSRGLFSKNKVSTVLAPAGLFGEAVTINYNNPFLPAAARSQFCTANALTAAQCTAAANATGPTDPNYRTFTSTVSRRTTEAGPRITDYTTTIFDYRAGAKINFTQSIGLDLSGGYGESQIDQLITGYLRTSRIRQASLATLVNGVPTCNDTSNGCVPINLFGAEGSITPAMLPFVQGNSTVQTKTSLAQARALLTGDIGIHSPLASEAIGFAAGAEYRKYRASVTPDILSAQAGELSGQGGATPFTSGGYEVREAYGEIIAPLIADVAGFKSLTVEGGIRYSDYKVFSATPTSYNTTTYKGGATYEPFGGLKFRGDYQRAVRAPNIAELFSPLNTGLTNLSTDPCQGAAPTTNANLRAVCLAQGAPAATIGLIAPPSSGQINATSGGSLLLRPEKSDSFTGGIVVQPRLVPGLSITVDYYNIKIDGAISNPTVGDVLAACFGTSPYTSPSADAATNAACTGIRRNPVTGGLDGSPATTGGLLLSASNLGQILTDGVDLGVNYRRNLGFAKLALSFQGNWTNRSKFKATPTALYRECVGYYSVNCGSPGSAGPSSAPGSIQPEFTWNQRTTLTFGPVDVSLLWRHLDAVRSEPTRNAATGALTYPGFVGTLGANAGQFAGRKVDFTRISAYNYLDLATRFVTGEHFDFTITVTNLLDKQPPFVGSSIGQTAYNSGNTYPSTYDALGRRFAVGARLHF